jgi:cysteinyl-tRNA synthetase
MLSIEAAIQKRKEAKQKGDFATADQTRRDLAEKGIILEDGPNGTTFRIKR